METITNDRELVVSGGHGCTRNATRAGYLPVPVRHVPPEAFHGIAVYLRACPENGRSDNTGIFTIYRGTNQPLTGADCTELISNGVELVYVRMADQSRFHAQVEAELTRLAGDPRVAISTKAAMVYETGVELINELLADPDVGKFSGRVASLARAVATMVLNDTSAFSHLFATSHHDFYTATHMVNVATYMVPLAHALGLQGPDALSTICQAGLLHDIGKLYVPETVLNKAGKLTEEDWWLLRRHPEMGQEHLRQYAGIDPLVLAVTIQHHERLDGTGYPHGLKRDEIELASQVCAVVDAFDAMTAFRPFKRRTLSIDESLEIIRGEAPQKYDQRVVDAWIGLVRAAHENPPETELVQPARPAASTRGIELRAYPRHSFNCPARLCFTSGSSGSAHNGALQVVAHSISQNGLGVLSQVPIEPGTPVRVHLLARTWSDEYFEGQTVRCRSYQDGWYEVGMRLTGRGAAGD